MTTLRKRLSRAVLTALLMFPLAPVQAQQAARPQFLYVLKVAPHLHHESTSSDKDKAATTQHFQRLQQATASGQVIFAGKTSEALDKPCGLVVFEAENEAAAKAFMQADPAVAAGVMTATLHPYAVALQRK